MSALPRRSPTSPDLQDETQVRRRTQRVVVRAGDGRRPRDDYSPLPAEVVEERRQRLPTLIGLGEEELVTHAAVHDVEAAPWLEFGVDFEEVLESSPRPATLRAGIDDALAIAYRQEAERILSSGVFPKTERDAAAAEGTPAPPAAMVSLARRLG